MTDYKKKQKTIKSPHLHKTVTEIITAIEMAVEMAVELAVIFCKAGFYYLHCAALIISA